MIMGREDEKERGRKVIEMSHEIKGQKGILQKNKVECLQPRKF